MKPSLLDVLVSPGDHRPLHLNGEPGAGEEAAEGSLSDEGGHAFPIRGGVPRMIPSGVTDPGGEQSASAETFGAKWARLDPEQRDRLAVMQREWFDRRFGFGDEKGLAEFLADRERILDAGTGPGLNAARFAGLTEHEVVGMDLSESVGGAQAAFGELSNLHFVQGDILDPPFPPESFDLVVSDQVIHHTPDCPRAFRTLARLLRPGGQIAVYVYREKAMMRELADEHVRALTTRMSVDECMELSEQLTELGRELSELDVSIRLEKGVPLLGIEPGEHDVQRLIYWCFLKCYWNEELGEELSTLINFDWYHPTYASRHTEDEVLDWCREQGLEVVHLDVSESGISVRAERPAGEEGS
ncbi:MAG: methyltransferase domain-containing protein [Solirubrobacterales bacterium]